MSTLIAPDATWVLWSVILGSVAVSIWLEQSYSWAARIGGPLLLIGSAIFLSNVRIMPAESPVYDTVQSQLVPLALPLLLFRADVFHIAKTTGWLLVAFHLSALGTVAGALLGALLFATAIPNIDQVTGIMTGSYIGGAINFFAVASTFRTNSNLTNPLLVADNFIMAGMFALLLTLAGSRWMKRRFPHPYSADVVDSRQLAAEHWKRKEIGLADIAASLAIAVALVTLAHASAAWLKSAVPDGMIREVLGNLYVHVTIWSVSVATVARKWLSQIRGAEEMGGLLLYIFLFVIGLPADLTEVVLRVPAMFGFCLVIALTNLFVTFALGRLLRLNLEDLTLAINATLGGPPSAAAMSIAMGWSKLVLPALLVGIYGYMIGTAVGLGVGNLVRWWQ